MDTMIPYIQIQAEPIDSSDKVKQADEFQPPPDCGGVCYFEGVIRNHNHGKKVHYLEYEAYEDLAYKELKRIAHEAAEKFDVKKISIIHRVGRLEIGDTAVSIRVATHHRREAFESCQYIIDSLKVRVPIWKKEVYLDGCHEWTQCTHS